METWRWFQIMHVQCEGVPTALIEDQMEDGNTLLGEEIQLILSWQVEVERGERDEMLNFS